MSVRVIAFGMVFILVFLFVAVKLAGKRMARQSQTEAAYADIIFRYKENPTEESLQQCIEEVSRHFNMSSEDTLLKLKNDGVVA